MIQLSDHFTYKRLIRFTLPSIIMILFTSVYGVVDGFFVSNFAGKTPFAAVNFIMPVLMILGCIGFMFGTGGSALLSLIMGQGKTEKANEIFSMLVYVSAFCGVVLAVLGILLLRPIASLMGADGKLLDDCWMTVFSMEESFCLHFHALFCSMNFSVCLLQQGNLLWDYISRWLQE